MIPVIKYVDLLYLRVGINNGFYIYICQPELVGLIIN